MLLKPRSQAATLNTVDGHFPFKASWNVNSFEFGGNYC